MFVISIVLAALLLVGMALVADGLYSLRSDGLRTRPLLGLVLGAAFIMFSLGWLLSAPPVRAMATEPASVSPSVAPGYKPNYDTPARKRYKKKEGLDMGRYET